MKKHISGYLLILSLSFLCGTVTLTGCSRKTAAVAFSGEEVYSPRYAEGFTIYGTDGASTVIEIRNPWQGADGVNTQIFVSRNGETAPEGFAGQTIKAPLERIVCFSSSHVAFLDALGKTDLIRGVSGADYISSPAIREGYAAGKIRDVGYDTNVNYELLASLRPDVVFIYGVGGENTAVTQKLADMNIPFMYIGEYVEENPLGKAEWIAVFGEATDDRPQAEAIFDGIATRYETLRSAAERSGEHPRVLINAPYRDVWFAPGDDSYMVRLIEDAGGEYLFAGESGSASRPISNEAAYMAALDADVWLSPSQALSISELESQNPKFAGIRCVENGRVYNNTRRRTPQGGSDFWESGALHADIVLRDLIICLAPDFATRNAALFSGDGTTAEASDSDSPETISWRGTPVENAGLQTYYFEKLQ